MEHLPTLFSSTVKISDLSAHVANRVNVHNLLTLLLQNVSLDRDSRMI